MAYLVTGGTGFLGKHFLDVLARRGERIYVLVRATSRARLVELASERWGAFRGRIVPVVGDVTEERCGLADHDIARLMSEVNDVFHLAALYDLGADLVSAERANVRGTANALALARELGARLHHVSSIAITGGVYDGLFREDMCDVNLRLEHPYYRTKLAAEMLIRRQSDVPYRVYRPGVIVGSSVTGEADKVDGPYYAFGLLRLARERLSPLVPLVAPHGGVMNVVPVDFVARAMDALAHAPGLDGRTFHLIGPDAPTTFEAFRAFARAAGLRNPMIALPNPVFRKLVPPDILERLPLGPAIKQGVLTKTGIPEAALGALAFRTRYDTRATDELLRRLGIVCPPLSAYAPQLFAYWERALAPARPATHGAESGRGTLGLRGKRVLISGASDGIGRALALRVAAEGATVVLVARRIEALERVRDEIVERGGLAFAHACDLTIGAEVDALLSRLRDEPAIDVLVNNAGRSIRRSVAHSCERLHDFERTMELNYFGALRLTLGVLPRMRAQRRGLVVNVSSVAVRLNTPRFAAYVASKAALDAFSRVVAGEVRSDGVRFSTIYLPLVRTAMIAPTSGYDRVPALRPEQAAELVTRAMLDGRREVVDQLTWWIGIGHTLLPGVGEKLLSFAYRNTVSSRANRQATRTRQPGGPSVALPGMEGVLPGMGKSADDAQADARLRNGGGPCSWKV